MYEDFLRTILHIELAQSAAPAEAPSALSRATYSGPSEVDGDQGSSTLRSRAAQQPRAAVPGKPAPRPTQDKPQTYRKSDDADPYVGVGRNDPCPCGSGKKFKHCHGRKH
jgi:preprotein translocase subunit SecA